jgi:hypothetical protein
VCVYPITGCNGGIYIRTVILCNRHMQVNVNFGQHGTAMTSLKNYFCHLFLHMSNKILNCCQPREQIGKKVLDHNTCFCVLVRRPRPNSSTETLIRNNSNKQFCNLVQILCFWTLSIVLPLSKIPHCLFFKTQLQ